MHHSFYRAWTFVVIGINHSMLKLKSADVHVKGIIYRALQLNKLVTADTVSYVNNIVILDTFTCMQDNSYV